MAIVSRTTRYTANGTTGAPDFLLVLARIVWFIAGVIIALLGLRFVFILLGANPANGFVNFIYSVSYPFARPFFGIFNYTVRYGVARVEFASLIAIVIYALIAYGITRLLLIGHATE